MEQNKQNYIPQANPNLKPLQKNPTKTPKILPNPLSPLQYLKKPLTNNSNNSITPSPKKMKSTKSNDLNINNLLFSTSQYDDDDDLKKDLNLAQNNVIKKNVFNLDEDDDDDGVVLGNGDSIDEDGRNWGDDEKEDGDSWRHQQNFKLYFRDVAGNSQNFSQSLSIHRPDLLESKGIHENSVNLDTINIQNILNAKKKQQEKVNEVLDIEISQLIQKIQNQQCLIKTYKKRIEALQDTIQSQKKQMQQVDDRNKQYIESLDKKDDLFNILKQKYTNLAQKIQQQQKIQKQLRQNGKSMEKEIDRLRNVMKSFTDHDRELMDFNTLSSTPKRSSESFKEFLKPSVANLREIQNLEAEMEKMRRQYKTLQMECELTKEDLTRKQEKFRNTEDELKRKLALKQKKIKQLGQTIEQSKQQLLKSKKTTENNATTLKQKLLKSEKDLSQKQQKLKQSQNKIKLSIDQIKKKQQKIKELLTEISDKNKKITELKDVLQQEEARNQIETRLQKERENQIDKLEQEVKDLKTEKFNLRREIENLEKPSNIEQKLKKQIATLKKDNQMLNKSVAELNDTVNGLEKEMEAKDDKLREFKKKNDQLLKKSVLVKKKSQDNQLKNQENQTYREVIANMTKQMSQLRKKAEANQQLANKYYILQSRIKYSQEKSSPVVQPENEYDLEQINEALREQLQNRDLQIQQIKQLHQKQIQRMFRELESTKQMMRKTDAEIEFKQKSLEYLHTKFQQLQIQNMELRQSKNILHSSFYDQSYDREENQTIKFYETKIQALEKKIQGLNCQIKEKDGQMRKYVADRENSSFQILQLKNRLKDLQAMAIASQSVRKIAPQSLSQEQTIDFLLKLLKRIIKSSEMLRSLSKISDFKIIIANLWKMLDNPMKK